MLQEISTETASRVAVQGRARITRSIEGFGKSRKDAPKSPRKTREK